MFGFLLTYSLFGSNIHTLFFFLQMSPNKRNRFAARPLSDIDIKQFITDLDNEYGCLEDSDIDFSLDENSEYEPDALVDVLSIEKESDLVDPNAIVTVIYSLNETVMTK